MKKSLFNFTLAKCAKRTDMLQIKRFGFTLAEVLITLGIIGVVAAMTIPTLITNLKAQQLRSKFLKSYSVVQQVFRRMIAEGEDIDIRNYSGATFYKTFAKYLTGATDCGGYVDASIGIEKTPTGCHAFNISLKNTEAKPYKYLKGESEVYDGMMNNGQLMLPDGTLIFFDDGPKNEGWIGVPIFIDINGANQKPNRLGYDFFAFEVVEGTVLPMGAKNTQYYNQAEEFCNLDSSTTSGFTCALKALNDSDYFKKLVRKVK